MITLEKDGESSEDLGLAISPSNCLSQYTLGLEGLEVDQSVHAPQLYPLPEGLQRAVAEGPEIAYDSNGLEPAPKSEPLYLKINDDNLLRISQTRRRKRIRPSIIFCVFFVIIAAGLGVGLGVGLQHPSSEASTSTSSPASNTVPTFTPSSTPALLSNGATNDTSLASVITPDNNRHLFFQDVNSTIRHAIFSSSQNAWLPSISFINSPRQPKMYTPISVLDFSNASSVASNLTGSATIVAINIYYVDINDTLAAIQFLPSHGFGSSTGQSYQLINNSFPVYKDTRSLSVSQSIANYTNGSVADIFGNVFLFSESLSRNITTLQGSFARDSGLWTWQNVSESLYSATKEIPQGAWIGPPFSASNYFGGGVLFGCFSNSGYLSDGSSSPIYGVSLEHTLYGAPQFNQWQHFDIPENKSELTGAQALANGTHDLLCLDALPTLSLDNTLPTFNSPGGGPMSPFPFSRLASSSTAEFVYVYHQLKESVIYEEIWQIYLGNSGWGKPNVIDIPTK